MAVLYNVSSYKLCGASGSVRIIAPLPGSEKNESPYELNACTFTQIEDPQGKLNGSEMRSVIGIVQLVVEITAAELPSQLTKLYRYVTPSDERINTL